MKRWYSSFMLLAILFFGFSSIVQSNTVSIEAEGSGATKTEALKDAWTNAVRQAVGMYTAARSEVLNDEFTEQIAAYSRGQINSFETLKESHADGIWTVTIRANIDRDVMQETVAASQKKTLSIDGNKFAARQATNENKKKDASELLRISDLADFSKCLLYNAEVKTANKDGKDFIYVQHVLKYDLNKFKKQSDELEKLIATLAKSKTSVLLNNYDSKETLKAIQQKDYDIYIDWPAFLKFNNIRTSKNKEGIYLYYPSYGNSYDYIGTGGWAITACINKKYFTDACIAFDGNPPNKNNFCFFKNTSSVTCYQLDEDIAMALHKSNIRRQYKLKFIVESEGNAYDSIHEESPEQLLSFVIGGGHFRCGRNGTGWDEKFMPGFLLAPVLIIKPNLHYPDPFEVPVLLSEQLLNISTDELAGLNNINARYELVPVQ